MFGVVEFIVRFRDVILMLNWFMNVVFWRIRKKEAICHTGALCKISLFSNVT